MKCVNITYLVELTFKGNILSLIKLLTIFWTVFMSVLMVLNSKIYK